MLRTQISTDQHRYGLLTSVRICVNLCPSIHSAVARHSKFRTRVPLERVLVESDHGYRDPPAAIPCRVEWVEHLVGQQHGLAQAEVRRLAWQNLATILRETGTLRLLPEAMVAIRTQGIG